MVTADFPNSTTSDMGIAESMFISWNTEGGKRRAHLIETESSLGCLLIYLREGQS
jgi:hypothetical protein